MVTASGTLRPQANALVVRAPVARASAPPRRPIARFQSSLTSESGCHPMVEPGVTPQKKLDCCMAGIRTEPDSVALPLSIAILRVDFSRLWTEAGLKSLSDAETIRAKILSAFELAEMTEDEGERARQMTFVLVGAGPTGVELAASLAQMVRVTLRGNFRRIDPSQSAIILLDAGNRVLPTFVEPLSRGVTRRLLLHGEAQGHVHHPSR